MKKEKILVSSLIVLSILFGSAISATAAPGEQPEGKPFQAIWQAIYVLQEKVVVIENGVGNLEDKVEALQEEIAVLAMRVLDLETWKDIIETWKTSVESRIAAAESEIGKLWEKATSTQAEIADLKVTSTSEAILAKLIQVDGSGSGLDADTVDGKHAEELTLWVDADGYVYPKNVGTSFQITDSGDLYVPSNVGIGTAGPVSRLSLYNDSATVLPATSGTTQNASILSLQGPGNQIFHMGVNATNNGLWMQNNNEGDLSINYPLLLNPNGGNVGIGTTNPFDILHVAKERANNGTDNLAQIVISGSGATNDRLLLGYNTTDDNGFIQSVHNMLGYTNLLLNPNGGNVGIGTVVPGAKLEVVETTANTAVTQLVFSATNAISSTVGLTLQNNDMTASALGGLLYTMRTDDAWVANAGAIVVGKERLWQGATPSATQDSFMAFGTSLDGTLAEKMRITSGGNVGIGTTNPQAKLDVNGTIRTAAGQNFNVRYGSGSMVYDVLRGGTASSSVAMGYSFSGVPIVIITSTSVTTDSVASVANKTSSSFDVILRFSTNSSAPSASGTYTFDWLAIGE